VPRLLPATEHTAWLGAHAPGAFQLRASGTTGAAAPSSRGPRRRLANAIRGSRQARPLAGRFPSGRASSPGVCPKRAASGQPAAAPACSPSVAGIAAPRLGRKAGFAVRGCSGQHRINEIEQEGQTTRKSAARHAQQCVWHDGLCSTCVRSQLTIFFIAIGRQKRRKEGR
jgi:hypothetical protein